MEGKVKIKEKEAKKSSKTKKSIDSDRRYLPRWEIRNRVLYRKEEDASYYECQSKDIHCNGACLYLNKDIDKGQELTLTLYLTDDIAVEVIGKVSWKKQNEQETLVGINFEQVSDEAKDIIFQYAFEFKKEELSKHWFEG